ncbi:MAG: alpha/beta hydrolase [Stutzerimonas stutzeri]|nr:MAG: alpha/beta hydrolase [Stutzerimonas stutzeri]
MDGSSLRPGSAGGGPAGNGQTSGQPAFLDGFRTLDLEAGGVRFAGVIGGEGPPLLLLHGYPETHLAWRKVAATLATRHTLVIPDLPGYGASKTRTSRPRWTKRRVAKALVALMRSLGFARFSLAGHDRGARVGYRLVLDHPGLVARFASLAVVPTLDAMQAVDFRYASKSYHWFLLSQPAPLPETLLAADPDLVIDRCFVTMGAESDMVIEPAVREAYRTAFRDPAVRHAMCEDYRAAIDEDLVADAVDKSTGRKLDCPVLVIWPRPIRPEGRPSPVETWLRWAADVTGAETSGGHLQPEDSPEEVLAALAPFMEQARV